MPPTALTAASTPWPTILVGVAVVVAVCLWLLFRPGSMADRARDDHADDEASALDADDATSATDDPDQPASGGR